MAENSKIEWTTHTFNPWYGCTKVSPGCEHCYAETLMDHRYGKVKWGKGQPRVRTGADYWKQPLKWNREANDAEAFHDSEAPLHDEGDFPAYERPRVFCASLADWLDGEAPIEWLADLLRLIFETPHLDWLLLTKRPENFFSRLRDVLKSITPTKGLPPFVEWLGDWFIGEQAPPNVWIGTTVEDQTRADQRIPELLKIPARVRFLSCEPLLGPVNFGPTGDAGNLLDGIQWLNHKSYRNFDARIHWVIAGGESGPEARPLHPDWARPLRDQCAAAGVPFFFKQWGEWVPEGDGSGSGVVSKQRSHGGSWDGDIFVPGNFSVGRQHSQRLGKKTAGRLLDGVEHSAFPTMEALA